MICNKKIRKLLLNLIQPSFNRKNPAKSLNLFGKYFISKKIGRWHYANDLHPRAASFSNIEYFRLSNL